MTDESLQGGDATEGSCGSEVGVVVVVQDGTWSWVWFRVAK